MPDLVAPIIPQVDNTAARIIGSGDIAGSLVRGFAAAAAKAERDRANELEAQRLAQQERIAQDQHAFEREKLNSDNEDKRALIEARNEVSKAHAYYFRTMADARSKQLKTGLLGRAEYNQQLQSLNDDANSRAGDLKLDDPEFQTKNPVEFAANLQKFQDEFGLAPSNTGIPQRLKSWQSVADQQKIPLKVGAAFDPKMKAWVGGSEKNVPIWQVVRDFYNPDTQEQTWNALNASGHVNVIKALNNGTTETTSKPDDFIRAWLEKGRNVDFLHSKSRVPTFVPHGGANETIKSGQEIYPSAGEPQDTNLIDATQQNDAETPLPPSASSGTVGTPTQTDIFLQQAQAAIAAGAPRDAVMQRLSENQIDPSLLDGTQAA